MEVDVVCLERYFKAMSHKHIIIYLLRPWVFKFMILLYKFLKFYVSSWFMAYTMISIFTKKACEEPTNVGEKTKHQKLVSSIWPMMHKLKMLWYNIKWMNAILGPDIMLRACTSHSSCFWHESCRNFKSCESTTTQRLHKGHKHRHDTSVGEQLQCCMQYICVCTWKLYRITPCAS